jgi:acetylglutamate kinase
MKMNSSVEALIEALPYISQFSGKIVVVKYGGAAMLDGDMQKSVMKDIVMLKKCGLRPIVVHGGGKAITKNLDLFGVEAKFVDGVRYTDEQSMEVAQMTLAGKVAIDLVRCTMDAGGNAVGLSGVDNSLIVAEPMGEEHGLVGRPASIDTKLLSLLIDNAIIPVISPLGVYDGEIYNINADTVASAIASSLQAEKLVILSDIDGVYGEDGSLISELKLSQIPNLIQKGTINGAMIPKIEACVEAMRMGVKNVHIINGTVPHSILMEMLTVQGIGTMIQGW